MKYLKLRISATYQVVLYEKDVEIRNAFEMMILTEVSALVRVGSIFEGEHYNAAVIPQYGDWLMPSPVVSMESGFESDGKAWIEMRFEESVHYDKPVRFFTIELRIKGRHFVFRRDVRMREVGLYYVRYGIEQTLVCFGVLKVNDLYHPEFFVRDDDMADFDREYIPGLVIKAAFLVELTTEAPASPNLSLPRSSGVRRSRNSRKHRARRYADLRQKRRH